MIAALIIAAGRTARGNSFEPMKVTGSITALQRILSVFRLAGIRRIVLVCGEDAQKAEWVASHMDAVCLRVADGAEMLDSVKQGLSYLRSLCRAALITPVDVPFFTVETVRELTESDADVCVPVFGGKSGHPLLLGASHFPAVLGYNGDGGLKAALQSAGLTPREVPVPDEGVLVNIRHNDNFDHLIRRHSLRKPHPEIRIRIAREKPFLGPGTYKLLLLTDETGTLRGACGKMGISYSKGWNMVSVLEEQLGFPVIERRQGGKSGGSSSLTHSGREMLKMYSDFCAEVEELTGELFNRRFDGWLPE